MHLQNAWDKKKRYAARGKLVGVKEERKWEKNILKNSDQGHLYLKIRIRIELFGSEFLTKTNICILIPVDELLVNFLSLRPKLHSDSGTVIFTDSLYLGINVRQNMYTQSPLSNKPIFPMLFFEKGNDTIRDSNGMTKFYTVNTYGLNP